MKKIKNCHYICKTLYRWFFTMCLALVSILLKFEKQNKTGAWWQNRKCICRDDYFILHGPILYLFSSPFWSIYKDLVEDGCIFLLKYLVELCLCLYVNKCCTFCNTLQCVGLTSGFLTMDYNAIDCNGLQCEVSFRECSLINSSRVLF